jgi:hypothetical protein
MKYQFIAAHKPGVSRQDDVPRLGGGGEWLLRLAAAAGRAQPPQPGEYGVGGAHGAHLAGQSRLSTAVRACTRCYKPKGSTAGASEWHDSCVNTG